MKISKNIKKIFGKFNEHISLINNSKLFAGLMIITLNIASKFVTIKLSKSVEAYLKFTFSKQILVFAMAWMGTRDIYIALFITIVFTICIEFLFNEESQFCLLPESFTNYHLDLLDNDDKEKTNNSREDEIKKAKEILEKAGMTVSDQMAESPQQLNHKNINNDSKPNMSNLYERTVPYTLA